MSCTSTPTETEYATSTSYSLTTFYSTATAVQVTNIGTTDYLHEQITLTSTVPIVVITPTKTLYATNCNGDQGPTIVVPQPTSVSTYFIPAATTPPPSTIFTTLLSTTVVVVSPITLADGSVASHTVTLSTMLPAPSHSNSKTNVTPIVASTVGGFFGLIAFAVTILWLWRRRRNSLDDFFENEKFHDNTDATASIPVRRQRDRSNLDLGAGTHPYRYGHAVPRAGPGSSPGSPHTVLTGTHSRNTSVSAAPLFEGNTLGRISRLSTAETAQLGHNREYSTTTTRVSNYTVNSSTPFINDAQSNTHSSSRSGGSVPVHERQVLQVINDDPSGSPVAPMSKTDAPSGPSGNVIVHTDGISSEPPPYSPT